MMKFVGISLFLSKKNVVCLDHGGLFLALDSLLKNQFLVLRRYKAPQATSLRKKKKGVPLPKVYLYRRSKEYLYRSMRLSAGCTVPIAEPVAVELLGTTGTRYTSTVPASGDTKQCRCPVHCWYCWLAHTGTTSTCHGRWLTGNNRTLFCSLFSTHVNSLVG